LRSYDPKTIQIAGSDIIWHQPLSLRQLVDIKTAHPNARLVVGNTEVGIEVKFKGMEYAVLVNPTKVPELLVLKVAELNGLNGLVVGASVTVNALRDFIRDLSSDYALNGKEYLLRGLEAIRHMLSWFASNQIRNVASVAGNIVTASPISDLNPLLTACGAVLNLARGDLEGSIARRQVLVRDFFLSYRKVDLAVTEIVENIFIPFTSEFEFVVPFKQARRREDDISIVTCGLNLKLNPSSPHWTVDSCCFSYGGMAPTTVSAKETAVALIGQQWSLDNIKKVFPVLRKELSLPVEVPGGQAEYRMALAVSFLFKCFFTVTNDLAQFITSTKRDGELPAVQPLDPSQASAMENFITAEKPTSRGEQHFTVPSDSSRSRSVGQSMPHRNAEFQVSGEAKYTGDMPLPANALHACLVTSTR
jgi:xanthine dehydrogenase/oxidase